MAFITSRYDFDAGIVISASHNPFEDNGIKVFLPNGQKLDEASERVLESYIFDRKEIDLLDHGALDSGRRDEFFSEYLDHFKMRFPGLSLADWRMVVDCANGAASRFALPLFESFGAEVHTINDSPDGQNINKNCGSLHLECLQKKVVSEHADFGVAFDGDADRALFADENGEVVDGDGALWIVARRLQDEGRLTNSTVVATVMSNIGLEIALTSRGIRLIRTAVGDKYVLDELLTSGASVGGEQSGHIIFPCESLVGDGLLTTLFVLDALAAKKRKLSKAVEGFTKFPQILVNVPVREKLPFESVIPIADAAREIERELDGSGRLLLRYSGTENLARVMIEGREQAEVENQANYLAEIIRAELG